MDTESPYSLNPRTYTLFGRRKGRRLRGKKSELIETLLPQLAIAAEEAGDLQKLFPDAQDHWLEIGFGGGEHLAEQAKNNPAVNLIGCEPFENGVASLLEHIDRDALKNIRIFPDDARILLDHLPDSSIGRCFVMFPDPWPKKRHAARRFIGPGNLPALARIMKTGGELRIASDDPLLQDWMEEHLAREPGFAAAPDTEKGLHPARPADWPVTRYEQKALAKKKYANWRGPRYYGFVRPY